ncbi:MAG: hydantoinase B/oxoprolinase family protein, partial [Chloroflexota bacterium]|nr:hydantoinase B/oxoprolinase family protein [Chloroflexota bacterium]
QWPDRSAPFIFNLFQLGGAGARAGKDGLSTTGFPSGVGGVPAEIVESLTPLVQYRRELRIDSGGAGKFRGGLGQATTMGLQGGFLGGQPWTLSAMIDRIDHPGAGLDGGHPGACGEFKTSDGTHPQPKALLTLAPDARVELNLPGGGGYGDPRERSPQRVLDDVVNGYVSLAAAEREYGVVVRYLGTPDQLVRLPEHYSIDEAATAYLRASQP